jgi:hypothetical protein
MLLVVCITLSCEGEVLRQPFPPFNDSHYISEGFRLSEWIITEDMARPNMCEPKDDLYNWLPIHDKVMMNWCNTMINYGHVLDF